MATDKEIVLAAKAKLQQGWIQGNGARDADGNHTWASSSTAVCWCFWGALHAAAEEAGYTYFDVKDKIDEIMDKFKRTFPERKSLVDWNDEPGRTKEEVLEAADKLAEVV